MCPELKWMPSPISALFVDLQSVHYATFFLLQNMHFRLCTSPVQIACLPLLSGPFEHRAVCAGGSRSIAAGRSGPSPASTSRSSSRSEAADLSEPAPADSLARGGSGARNPRKGEKRATPSSKSTPWMPNGARQERHMYRTRKSALRGKIHARQRGGRLGFFGGRSGTVFGPRRPARAHLPIYIARARVRAKDGVGRTRAKRAPSGKIAAN